MGRVNICIKDKLLNEINEGKEKGTNRSAVIQSTLEKYLQANRKQQGGKRFNLTKIPHSVRDDKPRKLSFRKERGTFPDPRH